MDFVSWKALEHKDSVSLWSRGNVDLLFGVIKMSSTGATFGQVCLQLL